MEIVMGDRCNVYIKQAGVYLYSHWDGETIAVTVRNALARKLRWNDPAYLARIVFQEMIGEDKAETGYGISNTIQDNGRSVITLDTDKQTISTDEWHMSFSDYIQLDDAEAYAWHNPE
jgi:hypothetical protein